MMKSTSTEVFMTDGKRPAVRFLVFGASLRKSALYDRPVGLAAAQADPEFSGESARPGRTPRQSLEEPDTSVVGRGQAQQARPVLKPRGGAFLREVKAPETKRVEQAA